jgi:hypothetical protein
MNILRARLPLVTALTLGLASALASSSATAQPAPQPPAPQAPAPQAPAPQAPAPQPPTWRDDPAKQADPPLLPTPQPQASTEGAATSASGTDVTPERIGPPSDVVVNAVDREAEARQDAKLRELEARLATDERRMRRLEERNRALRFFKLGAFAQPQLIVQSFDTNASPNQVVGRIPAGISANDVIAKSDGTTTNGTMFRMRRTRFRATFEAAPAKLYLEIDPFPLYGAGLGYGTVLRDAEVTATARWARNVRTELGAGVIMPAVRSELRERSDVRPFIERTWATQNFFPAERDIGVHARTLAMHDRLVFDLGILNGQRLGEPRFVQQPDLNKSKDIFAHLRYGVSVFTVAAAGYVGRGQLVDSQALRFKQYARYLVNYELSAHYRFVRPLGLTRLVAEGAFGENMDSGVFYSFGVPAIPANVKDDVTPTKQLAAQVRVEQELTGRALIGYRWDVYTADTSLDNNSRHTHAFIAIARISPNLRWMNEVDYAIDNIHAAGTGSPSKHILAFSSVLQAGF